MKIMCRSNLYLVEFKLNHKEFDSITIGIFNPIFIKIHILLKFNTYYPNIHTTDNFGAKLELHCYIMKKKNRDEFELI